MSKNVDVEAGSGDHQHPYPPPPPPPQQQYPPPQKGTFQVGAGDASAPQYPAPGYVVAGGVPVREPDPLPCGIGLGWLLFILGILFGVIPWYIGTILLLLPKTDRRERPGCIACAVAAVIGTIIIIVIATHGWSYN